MNGLLLQPEIRTPRSEVSESRPPLMRFRCGSGRKAFGTAPCAPAFSRCRAARGLIGAGLQQSRDEGTCCHGACRSENSALWRPLFQRRRPFSTIRAGKVLGRRFESIKNAVGGGVCVRATGGLPGRRAPAPTNMLQFASIKSCVVITPPFLI